MTREHVPLLLDSQRSSEARPVDCLGRVLRDDHPHRTHLLERPRQDLLDRGFRHVEGFPCGDIEDNLALSDPRCFTACPDPFIESAGLTS
jgi:hypothetical protein